MANRVLIVDDDDAVRMLIRMFLESEDALEVVGEADSCSDAMRMAAELQPDLVTMDYDMPGGNGADCVRELKARWPEVLILALSSSGDEATRSMIEAGAYAKLDKAHIEAVVPALLRVVELQGGARRSPADHAAAEAAEELSDLSSHFEQLRAVIAALEEDAAKTLAEQKKSLAQRVELVVALRAVLLAAKNPKYSPEQALAAVTLLASSILRSDSEAA